MKGEAYSVLNPSTTWNYYTTFNLEEQTGDALDDTVFARNRFIEEKFNTVIEVHEVDVTEIAAHLINTIMSGDDVYDVAYMLGSRFNTLFSTDYLTNLDSITEFNFDEPWWDQNTFKITGIGDGGIYFASDYTSLIGFEGATCMFFNKQMLEDLALENPYELVRDGKWTLDAVNRFTEAATNLNGDADFTWSATGNARYGFIGWDSVPESFWVAAGLNTVEIVNGEPTFAADSERFYNVAEKIAKITSQEGYIDLNISGADHYEQAFKTGRCLMILGQLKSASSVLRDMEYDYGVLPNPKYDEAQESYFDYTPGGMLVLPITNANPDKTAIIADAMAYYSFEKLLPVYYDSVLAYKGLRDSDSLEMLELVRQGLTMQPGTIYNWSSSLDTSIEKALINGDFAIASLVASAKSNVEASIAKTMEQFEK